MPKEKDPQYNTPWTDEMIARFLHVERRVGDENDPDFDAAIRAYQFIPVWEFHRYLEMFVAEGKNINAKNAKGQTITEYISGHSRSEHYVDLLKEVGAN
ncbi:MAG: PA4642 family protein [Venatoribacter sp.]